MRNFDEDRRICDAATEGPWEYEYDAVDDFHYLRRTNSEWLHVMVSADHDARFIAEAREGWPAALAEIERLQARVKELCERNAYYIDANERLEDALYELHCELLTKEATEDDA